MAKSRVCTELVFFVSFVLFFNCLDLKLQNNHLVVTDNGSASCDKEMNQ